MTTESREAPLQRRLPRVLSFSTSACPNCRAIKPTVETLAGEYSGTVEVVGVSADVDTDTAGRHKVRAVPTLIALDGDRELARHVGRGSEQDLRRVFEAATNRRHERRRVSSQDRTIRSLSGLGVITIALLAGTPWLAVAGGGFIIAGWWDLVKQLAISN